MWRHMIKDELQARHWEVLGQVDKERELHGVSRGKK